MDGQKWRIARRDKENEKNIEGKVEKIKLGVETCQTETAAITGLCYIN